MTASPLTPSAMAAEPAGSALAEALESGLSRLAAVPFPQIDPVLFQFGPLAIRWYALAYIAGLLLGWALARRLTRDATDPVGIMAVDAMVNAAIIGIIIGGRLGFVLFYNPGYYLANPLEILMVWRGGMAFHGGLIGVAIAIIITARQYRLPLLMLADIVALVAPIGLLFGRLANFINGELWGRTTDLPWGMVFPNGGPLPRHPSQLYEAGLEGLVLFSLLLLLAWRGGRRWPGLITGCFLLGYAVARGLVELVREPDAHLGILPIGLTMGQLLSLPMLAAGLVCLYLARRHAQRQTPQQTQ